MRHPDEGTIHAWLDGALDDAEGAWLESHIAGCAACGALVAEARGLVAGASRVLGALDAVPGGVLPADSRAAEQSASTESVRSLRLAATRSGLHQRARWAVPMRAAAALLLVAGGTMFVLQSTSYQSATAPMLSRDVASVAVPVFAPEAVAMDSSSAVQAPAAAESAIQSPAAVPATVPAAPPAATNQFAADAAPGQAGRQLARGTPHERAAESLARVAAPTAVAAPVAGAAAGASEASSRQDLEQRYAAAAATSAVTAARRSERLRRLEPLPLRPAPDSLVAPVVEAIVTGVVRDGRTGAPVEGASILLDNGDIGTLTDQLGRFTITGTTTGVHRAQVRRTGYASAEREVHVAGDSSVLEVQLTPAPMSVASALGEGYTPVDGASKALAGGRARAKSRQPDGGRTTQRTTRSDEESMRDSVERQKVNGDAPSTTNPTPNPSTGMPSLNLPPAVSSPMPPPAMATSGDLGVTTGSGVPLATRAPGRLGWSTQRDAAGRCLSIALRPIEASRTDAASGGARTIVVRLLEAVSRDTATDGRFALGFAVTGDAGEKPRGSWEVAPRAGEDERTATGVRLHWTAGGEEVRLLLDWSRETPTGLASVRRGRVGVDAQATATRLECRTVRTTP
jgi:hypothetical protein